MQGCDEFQAGATFSADLKVDTKVRTFMQASADFTVVADGVKASVFGACANTATDLGAQDTWSSLEGNNAISNQNGTGACDAAAARVQAILINANQLGANVAISTSRGECHLDFAAQASCDASCSANECTPGTVETRCEPGSLSVLCQAECVAGADCVGRPEQPANCMGMCESECVGACHGDCVHPDGTKTQADGNCNGKCSSGCNGICRGRCKNDSPVACGANVRCEGACTGVVSDPVCTSEFKPPQCTVDVDCHAACSAEVEASAVCDAPIVNVFARVEVSPDIQKLIDTLEANLPSFIVSAEAYGKLVLSAGRRLASSGESLSTRVGELDGKSLSCAATAFKSSANAVASLDVSAQASARFILITETNAE
jgi:hypothetical protein